MDWTFKVRLSRLRVSGIGLADKDQSTWGIEADRGGTAPRTVLEAARSINSPRRASGARENACEHGAQQRRDPTTRDLWCRLAVDGTQHLYTRRVQPRAAVTQHSKVANDAERPAGLAWTASWESDRYFLEYALPASSSRQQVVEILRSRLVRFDVCFSAGRARGGGKEDGDRENAVEQSPDGQLSRPGNFGSSIRGSSSSRSSRSGSSGSRSSRSSRGSSTEGAKLHRCRHRVVLASAVFTLYDLLGGATSRLRHTALAINTGGATDWDALSPFPRSVGMVASMHLGMDQVCAIAMNPRRVKLSWDRPGESRECATPSQLYLRTFYRSHAEHGVNSDRRAVSATVIEPSSLAGVKGSCERLTVEFGEDSCQTLLVRGTMRAFRAETLCVAVMAPPQSVDGQSDIPADDCIGVAKVGVGQLLRHDTRHTARTHRDGRIGRVRRKGGAMLSQTIKHVTNIQPTASSCLAASTEPPTALVELEFSNLPNDFADLNCGRYERRRERHRRSRTDLRSPPTATAQGSVPRTAVARSTLDSSIPRPMTRPVQHAQRTASSTEIRSSDGETRNTREDNSAHAAPDVSRRSLSSSNSSASESEEYEIHRLESRHGSLRAPSVSRGELASARAREVATPLVPDPQEQTRSLLQDPREQVDSARPASTPGLFTMGDDVIKRIGSAESPRDAAILILQRQQKHLVQTPRMSPAQPQQVTALPLLRLGHGWGNSRELEQTTSLPKRQSSRSWSDSGHTVSVAPSTAPQVASKGPSGISVRPQEELHLISATALPATPPQADEPAVASGRVGFLETPAPVASAGTAQPSWAPHLEGTRGDRPTAAAESRADFSIRRASLQVHESLVNEELTRQEEQLRAKLDETVRQLTACRLALQENAQAMNNARLRCAEAMAAIDAEMQDLTDRENQLRARSLVLCEQVPVAANAVHSAANPALQVPLAARETRPFVSVHAMSAAPKAPANCEESSTGILYLTKPPSSTVTVGPHVAGGTNCSPRTPPPRDRGHVSSPRVPFESPSGRLHSTSTPWASGTSDIGRAPAGVLTSGSGVATDEEEAFVVHTVGIRAPHDLQPAKPMFLSRLSGEVHSAALARESPRSPGLPLPSGASARTSHSHPVIAPAVAGDDADVAACAPRSKTVLSPSSLTRQVSLQGQLPRPMTTLLDRTAYLMLVQKMTHNGGHTTEESSGRAGGRAE